MRPSGAHTHPSGGNAVGALVAVVVVVAVVVAVARAVAHAVAEALPVILVAVAVVTVLGGAVAAVLVSVSRADRRAYTAIADNDSDTPGVTYQRHEPVAAPPRHAELPTVERHEHIHFHGLSPRDVAAIVAARKGNQQ